MIKETETPDAPSETVRYCCPPLKEEQDAKKFMQQFPFPKRCGFVYDDCAPEICLMPRWRLPGKRVEMQILRNWRRYLQYPVIVVSDGEYAGRFPDTIKDFSFSYSPGNGKNCMYMRRYKTTLFQSLLPGAGRNALREALLQTSKTRFCNFIYSNSKGFETQVRIDFCKLLSQHKRVDCPGESLNNTPPIKSQRASEGLEEKLRFMAGCKFSIAFENASQSHYLTEKLFHALYAGSVPVYWGCPEAAEYYNPAAFINCHDYASFEDVVQRVMEIDQNPRLYEEYRNAPPILPQSRFFAIMRQAEGMCSIVVDEALRRRASKTKFLRAALRFCQAGINLLRAAIRRQRRIAATKKRNRRRT